MDFKNKRILITAGPTWVPIDNVRVISNTATGQTGILLSEKLRKLGAKVTLVLGPVADKTVDKGIKVIRFCFFDEFKKVVISELEKHKYNAVIHSAAVSDYKPKKVYSQKIKSGINNLQIILKPTPKIINLIRRIDSSLFLVGFKYELGITKKGLLTRAGNLNKRLNPGLTVANTIRGNRYEAYIMNKQTVSGPFREKNKMADGLLIMIGKYLCLKRHY
ncbi:MAG: phosphopantothenoylcysteine decarboxylase [Candidatus Omnitrophota bacterium]